MKGCLAAQVAVACHYAGARLRKPGVPDLRGKRRTYGDRKVGALS